MEFKERLKKLRTKHGLTQEALARKIFVSRSAIAKWEAGLGMPNEESIEALCQVLGAERQELLPNSVAEPLLIEKNVKLKRRAVIAIVLAITLFISLTALAVIAIKTHREKKEIFALTPTLTKFYFETKRGDPNFTAEYNSSFMLYKYHATTVYLVVSADQRLAPKIQSVGVTFDGSDTFTCTFMGELSSSKKEAAKKLLYRTTVRMTDTAQATLSATQATFTYYDEADRNEHKKRDMEITATPLPICISNTRVANVKLKLNAETVYEFSVEKGNSFVSGVLDVGEQEYFLQNMLDSKVSTLIGQDKVRFDGYKRADGKPLDEPIYYDTEVLAVVTPKQNASFDFRATDISANVFMTKIRPTFTLDSTPYTNVKYTLSTDSDCIEISQKCAINTTKPGTATVCVDFDLGFYSGKTQFTVNVSDKVHIQVFGYRREYGIGSYYITIEGKYDYSTGNAVLTDTAREELETYFEKQNADFLAATGYTRTLVELKQISPLLYVPVFETDHAFDDSTLSLQIGAQDVRVDDITPITLSPGDTALRSYSHQTDADETGCKYYYCSNGKVISPENITAMTDNLTLVVHLYFIIDGVYYYTEHTVPVTVTN